MADIWQVQDTFWNSFGIPAYDEQSRIVLADGDSPKYPHLTYESFDGVLDQTIILSINLWYRSPSWAAIKQKTEEIKSALTAGKIIKTEHGFLWLKIPGNSAFAQPVDSGADDDYVKRMLITVEAEALTT